MVAVPGRGPAVGRPLPHVAGHVVQPVAVGRERPDGCRPGVPVLLRVARPGTCPGRRSSGARRPVSASRPTGSAAARGRRAPRTPTPPRWAVGAPAQAQYACASSHETWTTGWSARSATSLCGPSGWRPVGALHLAPPRRLDDAPGGWEVVGQEPTEHERRAHALGVRDVPGRRDELGELRVRDRVTVQSERAQLDRPHRALAVLGVGAWVLASHEEAAAADPDQPGVVAVSGPAHALLRRAGRRSGGPRLGAGRAPRRAARRVGLGHVRRMS